MADLTVSDLPSQDHSRHWLYVAAPSVQSFASNEHTGKWYIFRSTDEVDHAWETIQALAAANKIVCAKSPPRSAADISTATSSASTPRTGATRSNC